MMLLIRVKLKVVSGRIQPAGTGLRHRVVEFPVLVAHRRWRRARVVEEGVARRLLRFVREVIDLVDAIESRLDDPGIVAFLDLCLQFVALGASGDFDERGQPVERREDFLVDRSRLDNAPASE